MLDARRIIVTGLLASACSAAAWAQMPQLPGMPQRSTEGARPGMEGLPFRIPGIGQGPRDEEPEQVRAPVKPSDAALDAIEGVLDKPMRLVQLGLAWLEEGRHADSAAAFEALRERHPSMKALALYNEGCVHHASGDRALGEQFFQRALAEPRAERIHRLATFNLGSVRLERVAHRRDQVLPGLDPIRNALQAGPQRAWEAYEGAMQRSIEDLTVGAAMFRAALLSEPTDGDALTNLRYARAQIVELRRERERVRRDFEQFLTEVIQPREALEKIMDLTERQRELAEETGRAERLRESERSEQISEILRDQKRVTAETEDLLRRLDAMAKRSDELFGDDNPMLAGLMDQLMGTGADAIADAIAGQRWADFELQNEEYDAARDLQMQASEDLRSILEDFAAQVENIEDLMEMFADQMEQQIEEVEQEFEGAEAQEQPEEPSPGEAEEQVEGDREGAQEVVREILEKEVSDTDRRDAFERRRRRDRGERDW